MEMKHSSHHHALILNEKYIARDGDVCRGCSEQIFSSKSFVYSCSRITGAGTSTDLASVDDKSCPDFLLHKNCAELPECIKNPADPEDLLHLCFDYSNIQYLSFTKVLGILTFCNICGIQLPWNPKQFFYWSSSSVSYICLDCVMFRTQHSLEAPKIKHPAHIQHLLSLIERPSSFKCYACNVDDNIKDMSYRCTTCRFWMHKSCADAPKSFQFQFHVQHPLILSFSLPQVYHKFAKYCRLCHKQLSRLAWLYYCGSCQFFTHFQCARSFNGILNASEDEKYDSDVVQLPAADESLVNLLYENFIKATSNQNKNNDSILTSVSGIKHWTHEEHYLQVIDMNELKNQQDVDKLSLLCDGCTQSIRSDEDQFYGCVPCKYFLHKFCAELPDMIKLNFTNVRGVYATASEHWEPYNLFRCRGCRDLSNGIFYSSGTDKYNI